MEHDGTLIRKILINLCGFSLQCTVYCSYLIIRPGRKFLIGVALALHFANNLVAVFMLLCHFGNKSDSV